jgi:phosphatidylinositol glycan class N
MYFLGFGPCFVILSIREEGLFYVAYSITLFHWIQVEQIARLGSSRENEDMNEKTVKRPTDYSFQWDDVRTALFFLFFVQVGFFGTGK